MATPPGVRRHYRTCHLCEAMCGIEIKLKGERIVSITGDKADPFSKGHICPKAVALQDIYADADRLKQPIRRTQSGWQSLTWDEAFDAVAENLQAVQKKYGRDAVGIYLGNPTVHNVGSLLYGPPFIRCLRTKNRFSATSVDQLPHQFAAHFMFGHQFMLPVPDVDRSDYFLMLGANPLVSNGSLMTAPGISRRLKDLRNRGGKLVVVDPRRTETAVVADEHFFIRPGTDVLLLLALLHTIFAEKLARPERLRDLIDGLETIQQIAADFPPEQVAATTGIGAETIRRLAREFCAAKAAVCYGRFGVSTQDFGSACQWLINVLNTVTGNLDRPGGAMFTRPAIDVVGRSAKAGRCGHYDRWRSRVRNLPEFGGELPVAVLAEEILTGGEGQIKAMITVAGNPVLSTPNGRQMQRALGKLEFMVSIDIYLNETTRHANIILPPTWGLETDHYDLVFHTLAVRNTVKYSPALFAPAEASRHDWQIFRELRRRLSGPPKWGVFSRMFQKLRDLPPARLLDLALRLGPYGAWNAGGVFGQRLHLRKLKKHVHGIDLGPLQPCLPQRLFTPNKKIQLAPDILVRDMVRVKAILLAPDRAKPADDFDLLLIGRRHLLGNNSWMHNSPRLVRGKDRCTLLMHPEDARARGIVSGQTVDVRSRTGRVEIPVEITEAMMPGVVCMPHGWGHDRPGIRLQTAAKYPGVSVNDITDEQALDQVSGNAAFSSVRVMVCKLQNRDVRI